MSHPECIKRREPLITADNVCALLVADRLSGDITNVCNTNPIDFVADEPYSLPDQFDSESITNEFKIGLHSDKEDFTNHVKMAVR